MTRNTISSKDPTEILGYEPFELILQTLETHLDVQPGHEKIIHNKSQLTTLVEKHAATVYIIANIAQKLECFIEAKSVCQNIDNMDPQSNTSHIVFSANNFVWTKSPKPKEWKMKYLPILFCAEENEPHSIVSTEVQRILKQERNVFKKKIL
ncbi:hypothetical protein BY996DRAFT_6412708 [Phakopsora pachyrhizi]|nr:hypothetical protein BY996DRAFT_6412708 [Phakopsora pachyrhizi]